MISFKHLNTFQKPKDKKYTFIKLSNYDILNNKKGKDIYIIPEETRIITPKYKMKNNKKYSSFSFNERTSIKSSKFNLNKKVFIKSNENQKSETKKKFSINLSPCNRSPQKQSQSFVKYIRNYPKTFYQKIYNNIQKMKIRADKTINVMRKNLKLTNQEIFNRATNLINFYSPIKKKDKNKKINSDEEKEEKNNTNIHNKSNKSDKENKENNKNNKIIIDIEPELKTESISNKNKSKKNGIAHSHSNIKKYLGLSKISLKPFYKVKIKPFYVPLFKANENSNKFYKNMYHVRFDNIKEKNVFDISKKIYDSPYKLKEFNKFIKEPDIQLKNIYNKLKILINNLQFFHSFYLIKKEFCHAFFNMENQIKAELNKIMEELISLLLKIIPLLLKEFYFSLPQLLFMPIPQLSDEMLKTPTNEIECLKLNIYFFNKITEYFSSSVEIFNIIKKQIEEFKFTPNEYNNINNIIDWARYDSSTLISMAKCYIEKTKNDDDLYYNLEIGLKLRSKKTQEKDSGLEKFHERRKIKIWNNKDKIDRIKSALNIGARELHNEFLFNLNKKYRKQRKNSSILETDLIRNMMKYFNSDVKEQIISQQVINKFTKKKEIERLGYNEDNVWVNDGSSIQFFDKEDQRRKNKH